MIEFPESTNIAKQINDTLTGKTIADVIVEGSAHRFAFYSEYKEKYRELLTGKPITGAESHGGIVQINMPEYFLGLSDGAYPKYAEEEKYIPKRHQLLVLFTDGSALSVGVQMYGSIRLYPNCKCDNPYYLSSFEKPEPTSGAFTFDYFKSLLPENTGKLTAKAFLATEQRIPGLGNGVLQDILFNTGLDPRFEISKLSESGLHALFESFVKTLAEMKSMGGRDTETDLFGNKCEYTTLMSKNTLGTPCPKCGAEIKKASYMGGTVYFCEKCRKRE